MISFNSNPLISITKTKIRFVLLFICTIGSLFAQQNTTDISMLELKGAIGLIDLKGGDSEGTIVG